MRVKKLYFFRFHCFGVYRTSLIRATRQYVGGVLSRNKLTLDVGYQLQCFGGSVGVYVQLDDQQTHFMSQTLL